MSVVLEDREARKETAEAERVVIFEDEKRESSERFPPGTKQDGIVTLIM